VTFRVILWLLAGSAIGIAGRLCPAANVEKSGSAAGVAWTSGSQQIAARKICIERSVSVSPETATAVSWPAAGILSTHIAGKFTSSFCCAERVAFRKSPILVGSPARSISALALAGHEELDGDYPDLMESDAKVRRYSFTGRVWDGAGYVDIDLEFRASASRPYYRQSLIEFVITDQSSQPLVVDWDLAGQITRSEQSYFTESPKGSPQRQTTRVFHTIEPPVPAGGIAVVKTASGNVLAQFRVDGFKTRR
jgi:hypothetical protein